MAAHRPCRSSSAWLVAGRWQHGRKNDQRMSGHARARGVSIESVPSSPFTLVDGEGLNPPLQDIALDGRRKDGRTAETIAVDGTEQRESG